ncbi:TonB-dependent receptor [Horticoccus sp. 23ND18S-11]|uniref:TonB-dependent receptor n=1 Tax=Horticoccus sp. 23ND18S-11 TaxID=3391832 RepID=UPI0039C95D17
MTELPACRVSVILRRSLRRFIPALAAAWALVLLAAPPAVAAEVGVVTGAVSNTATGNLLEGARVAVPQLGLTTLTDDTGRFVLANVPVGSHELVVSYIGLDTVRSTVVVAAGQRATRNFDLTTAIYQLDAFKVTGEREGGAAAITAQRNADNVKNIVAMDSFGNLPNMNAGEVAIRLPGVAGNLSDENLVDGFTIRGIGPGLNSVTLDGSPLTSQGALTRSTNINNLTGTMFDQLELTKGHTPDKGADSLGGTINLKSRSPLSMREKRRISYSAGVRIAPSFTEQVPLREAHRAHPLFNVAWQEVFGVLGGERNLGVSVNLFYSENAVGGFRTVRDFQNTTAQPAYVWDYRTWDNYNNRKQASINVKTDYRLSANTKLSLNAVVNDAIETFRRQYESRAFTAQTVGTTGTAGILPGYTDRITQVRASTASTIDITSTGPGNFYNRMRRLDFGVEQQFGRLQLDYNALYTQTNINGGGGGRGGILVNRITNVGWILDRTQSDLFPRFTQTEGADFTNAANYRPTTYNNSILQNDNDNKEVRGNARYELPVSFPLYLKAGALWREQYADASSVARRWNYAGTTALPADPTIRSFDTVKTGRRLPQWEAVQFVADRQPITPALWREDLYFYEQNKYTANRAVTEEVTAGYAMAQGRVGRTGFIAGVRTEKTDTSSWGWVRARNGSTVAQQTADPVGSAQRDYANTQRRNSGSYTKSFPSAHLTHDVTPNIKARLSWSTSFGRPALNNALPNETINETNQTLTVNNPSLLPQTAENWDAALDYYFEPVGNLSVAWFHKTIKDYIVTGTNAGTIGTGTDNGFNGEYPGFTRLTSANAGTAIVQGWEFAYQQQFTFLPGWLKGLGASANFTVIATHGNFGGTTERATDEVPGFIPRTGNASLSWRHKRFSTRVLYNYTGDYITAFTAASVGRNLYRYKYSTVTAGVAYQYRPWLQFTADVANLFNEPQAQYRGIPDQMANTIINGTTITLGVNGRF